MSYSSRKWAIITLADYTAEQLEDLVANAIQRCVDRGGRMKVKLKDKKMDTNYGLFRPQMKALNRGEVIEINEIPKDAKPYLAQVNETKKKEGK